MEKLIKGVDKWKELIYATENYIWENPETGYKEVKTTAYMKEQFEKLGYTLTMAENTTGFFTVIDTGREGPTVLVLGELDSVICPSHPCSDKVTGAVHACGHHCQCAALVGIAASLKEEGALDALSGKIMLCAVPAEELLEIGFRRDLIKKGVISYFGGKTEFLSRGYFDNVDMAFMIHTGGDYSTQIGHIGCIAKEIIYKGKASHAGGNPWDGNNALYAATNGLNSANALRETFYDGDVIRFHPIITEGGQMVNAIPEKVKIESYVRGKTYDAILKVNKRINQALCGSALSLNTNVEIIDAPGYAPEINDPNMTEAFKEAMALALPSVPLRIGTGTSSGSTDMGDLSCLMPTIQPFSGGSCGLGHGNNYYIKDHEQATVNSAKAQLGLLYVLLKDNAIRAKEIIASFTPRFASIKDYLDYINAIFSEGNRVTYNDDGTATVKI